jgi:hypothetical protein
MTRLRPRKRDGRCYELAWKYQSDDDRFAEWTLVHGEVAMLINGSTRMLHAWLTNEGKVYDPVLDRLFNEAAYTQLVAAKSFAWYSRREAAKMVLEHDHFGPWCD